MINASFLLAALAILSPQDGAVVPTLNDGQRTYLEGRRAERFLRMDNMADRARIFAFGAHQKPVKLAWSGDTDTVYVVTVDYAEGGAAQTFVVSNRTDVYVTNLELGRTYQWIVADGQGSPVSASFTTSDEPPRLLRADGVGNFRDLGGWKTAQGGHVRQNMIFRSAGLRGSSKAEGGFLRQRVTLGPQRVKPEGIATLRDAFKIKTDLELRTPQETAGMETTLLGPDVRWFKISFAAYDFISNEARGREPFVRLFRIFADKTNYPILMHCSGGRDRTGTLAFLLNGLLGVSEDDLCRDWECSIFSDQGQNFTSDRIQRLLDYLHSLPGETLQAKIETYMRSSGVTADEIAAFRQIMLPR